LTSGTSTPSSALYDSAVFAGPQGWIATGANVANTHTAGSPRISTWGTGHTYVSSRIEVDVSGRSIADVVRLAQDLNANTESTVIGVNADQLSGTMPAGARIFQTRVMPTASPVGYRESDGFIGNGVTTLAGMVTAFPVPAPGVVLGTANTVSLGRLHSDGCGATFCAQERLRGAFGSDRSVTYYLCDIDVSTGAQTNCTTQGTGSYSQSIAADGVTPIMTFAGLPAAASVQQSSRVFVERNGHVYLGFQEKLVLGTHTRLNDIAFQALADVLGIAAPSTAAASPYAGTWTASYAGGDTGGCATITISAAGQLSGSCASTGVGGTFAILGSVAANGSVTFSANSSGATFIGVLGSTSGSGSWNWPSHNASGTWTVSRQ